MWRYLLALILLITPPFTYAVEFTISEPSIFDNEITLTANIISSSKYYLQGALQRVGSSYYFGQTQNNQDLWIDYLGSPEKEYIVDNFFVTDPVEASWSGKLKLRFNSDDKNYLGPGEYNLKLNRYTGNSNSPAGVSNNLTIVLAVATPTPQPSPTPDPTHTPTPTPQPSEADPPRADTPSPSRIPSPSPDLVNKEGTVAGLTIASIHLEEVESPSPSPDSSDEVPHPTLNQDRARTALFVGSGLIFISLTLYLGYNKFNARDKL